MKTYFVCSDIHGFYKSFTACLLEAGFSVENDEHILIVLGDIFDRGKEPWKIYKFLTSLPKERLVLVKGNHEYLLLELIERKFPFSNDISNGTYQTLISLHKDPKIVQRAFIKENINIMDKNVLFERSFNLLKKEETKLYDNKKINEIASWLNSGAWQNYYELGKYIFVHSFIPLKDGEYFSSWRECKDPILWEDATWHCPFKLFLDGKFNEEIKKGKVLVCGHWHTSDFYNNLLYKDKPLERLDIKKDNPIFKSDLYPNLIALDTCTALTKKVNVLVLKENEL